MTDFTKDVDLDDVKIISRGGKSVDDNPPGSNEPDNSQQDAPQGKGTPGPAGQNNPDKTPQPPDQPGEPGGENPEEGKADAGASEGDSSKGEDLKGSEEGGKDAQPAEVFETRLSELTGGKLKTADEFNSFISEHDSLVDKHENLSQENEQLKAKIEAGPEFSSEKAKKAYEMISRMPGDTADAAKRFFHVMSLTPEKVGKMSDKQIQFEGFLLDPKNADLSENEAVEVFNARYEKLYGDLEELEGAERTLTERDHKVATNEAKQKILELQEEYDKAKEPGPESREISDEDRKEVQINVDKVLNGYDALKVTIDWKDDDGKVTGYDIDLKLSEDDLKGVKESMASIDQWFIKFMDNFRSSEGFDYTKFRNAMAKMVLQERIQKEVFAEGINQGRIMAVKSVKNAQPPETPTTPQTPQEEESLLDAWGKAVDDYRAGK